VLHSVLFLRALFDNPIRWQAFWLTVTAVVRSHRIDFDIIPPMGSCRHSPSEQSRSSTRSGKYKLQGSSQDSHCCFAAGVHGLVTVHRAPVKTVARMREKLSKCLSIAQPPPPPFSPSANIDLVEYCSVSTCKQQMFICRYVHPVHCISSYLTHPRKTSRLFVLEIKQRVLNTNF
jgi:hypothetical protein